MLIVLSPAKNLNFDSIPHAPKPTKPRLLKDTAELADVTRNLTKSKLKSLMGISDALAELNFERFQAFRTSGKISGTKSAAFAFNGDVYWGLEAKTLSTEDLEFAQRHLRILSGLYGVLRPLDAIQPYRLEMGSRLKNSRGANLYEFWNDRIAIELRKATKTDEDKTIVNLASKEYFSAVDRSILKAPVIAPVFKEEKDGKLRSLQFFAKRARGAMARWAIQQRIERAADLKAYNVDGYAFQPSLSDDETWIFTRPQPPKKS
ncbi:MAG: peroxide stress protein YaaA [Pseudomonadota bacterium]